MKLAALGLVLPPASDPPAANRKTCTQLGNVLWLSGHGGRLPDLPQVRQRGKVGDDVSKAEAYATARAVALTMLSTIKRHTGDLDRVQRVLRLFGMVNVAPGFIEPSSVIDGASDLFFELWGAENGQHVRTAIGVAELTNRMAVEIQGEFELVG
ncbi:MAG TPA: RidA family protein [Candidatus Binataceae bacterium]|nr:RidA family protein [Candidatus Binataceae bacterium]